jgi:predicted RNA binding protein YcfA (HicA-like mRNA interferase family)
VSRRTYSGEELIKALRKWNYIPVDREGSHIKLRYTHPETGEVRNVTVPKHDELSTGTLRNIADQCGANDFQEFLDAIEQLI